jgi:hypothetical protein
LRFNIFPILILPTSFVSHPASLLTSIERGDRGLVLLNYGTFNIRCRHYRPGLFRNHSAQVRPTFPEILLSALSLGPSGSTLLVLPYHTSNPVV